MNALTFPYTWSNPNASNEVLLANALVRPRFSDLVTLMQRFGEQSLNTTLDNLVKNGELPVSSAKEVRGMLSNIAKGFHEYQRRHTA